MEIIPITYEFLIRSLFMYAAHIWFPNISPSLIQNLQTIHNSALRIATVCIKMTSTDNFVRKLKCFLPKITFP